MDIHPIHPIRTDADHAAAMAEIDRLWKFPEGSPEEDRLDVLVTLVEAYERERWPIDSPDPVATIEAAMEAQGHTQNDLAKLLGKSRASEVLARKRSLSLKMIRALEATWHIPATLLVKDYPLQS